MSLLQLDPREGVLDIGVHWAWFCRRGGQTKDYCVAVSKSSRKDKEGRNENMLIVTLLKDTYYSVILLI